MNLTLVTGPSASGKSLFAEQLARRTAQVLYVATGPVDESDAEWQARLGRHRLRRPKHWRLVETGRPDAPTLTQVLVGARADECLLVDSLGGWLSTRLLAGVADQALLEETDELLASFEHCPARLVVVSEEVGWGVVPAHALGRRFRDRLGLLTRTLARRAGAVFLVAAGYALDLHQIGMPVPEEDEQS